MAKVAGFSRRRSCEGRAGDRERGHHSHAKFLESLSHDQLLRNVALAKIMINWFSRSLVLVLSRYMNANSRTPAPSDRNSTNVVDLRGNHSGRVPINWEVGNRRQRQRSNSA